MTEPLGLMGAFHLRSHREMLALGLSGNGGALLVELEGHLAPGELEGRAARAFAELDELRWQLGRGKPGPRDLLGGFEPRWHRSKRVPPGVWVRRRMVADTSLAALAASTLDEPVDGQVPWRLELAVGEERDVIILRWFHPLMDAPGAARLMRWLGTEVPAPAPTLRFAISDRRLDGLPPDALRKLRETYVQHVFELGKSPIVSLERASAGRRAGRHVVARMVLSLEESAAFDTSLRHRSSRADTPVMLRSAGLLVDELMRRRGYRPPRQLVPVPMSLDEKAGSERMFGNNLALVLLTLDRDALDDEATAVTRLAAQRRTVVRDKLDLASLASMHAVRHLPWRLTGHLMRRPFGGQRCSFVLSNPGAIALDTFAGLQVRHAFAVASVAPWQGVLFIADQHHGRRALSVVSRRGFTTQRELTDLLVATKRTWLAHRGPDNLANLRPGE